MDPTKELCLIRNSFQNQDIKLDLRIDIPFFSVKNRIKLEILIKSGEQLFDLAFNKKLYHDLMKTKSRLGNLDDKEFDKVRNKMNEFERIGRSIFMNRAAVKIANIDSILKITEEVFDFERKQSNKNFTFCDIASGPGGFTQYFQYRFPRSIGYGMTLRGELDWATDKLDMKRFNPIYGKDDTGNLYTNWRFFTESVFEKEPSGVDLVTADGGFEMEDLEQLSKEFLSSKLLFIQVMLGMILPKVGGNFVLKIFSTVTEFSADIIYILALCFEKISIFKPVSSRPANSERYIVCLGKKDRTGNYVDIMIKMEKEYEKEGNYIQSFLKEKDNNFINWLENMNEISMIDQMEACDKIIEFMERGHFSDPRKYNPDNCLIFWNLPDTPRSKYSKIKI